MGIVACVFPDLTLKHFTKIKKLHCFFSPSRALRSLSQSER